MTPTMKRKVRMHLGAMNAAYIRAESKLREAMIAARSVGLDGQPLLTYREIADELHVSQQAVHQYIKRWQAE